MITHDAVHRKPSTSAQNLGMPSQTQEAVLQLRTDSTYTGDLLGAHCDRPLKDVRLTVD
jgi:hypothetical protein